MSRGRADTKRRPSAASRTSRNVINASRSAFTCPGILDILGTGDTKGAWGAQRIASALGAVFIRQNYKYIVGVAYTYNWRVATAGFGERI